METKEYFGNIEKSGWDDGPWFQEPDKRQWPDEATGLPCLMVRGPLGAWCGYVGVDPTHPAHGLHYDGEPDEVARARSAAYRRHFRKNIGKPLEEWTTPDDAPPRTINAAGEAIAAIEVHGGLTFAGECADTSRVAFEQFRSRKSKIELEAHKFPRGDAARFMGKWRGCFDDYDRWRERTQATSICHLPAPGEPDDVWWFGFDCAHCFDLAPGMRAVVDDLNQRTGVGVMGWQDVYRDVAYVEAECAKLAQQLAAITQEATNEEQAQA